MVKPVSPWGAARARLEAASGLNGESPLVDRLWGRNQRTPPLGEELLQSGGTGGGSGVVGLGGELTERLASRMDRQAFGEGPESPHRWTPPSFVLAPSPWCPPVDESIACPSGAQPPLQSSIFEGPSRQSAPFHSSPTTDSSGERKMKGREIPGEKWADNLINVQPSILRRARPAPEEMDERGGERRESSATERMFSTSEGARSFPNSAAIRGNLHRPAAIFPDGPFSFAANSMTGSLPKKRLSPGRPFLDILPLNPSNFSNPEGILPGSLSSSSAPSCARDPSPWEGGDTIGSEALPPLAFPPRISFPKSDMSNSGSMLAHSMSTMRTTPQKALSPLNPPTPPAFGEERGNQAISHSIFSFENPSTAILSPERSASARSRTRPQESSGFSHSAPGRPIELEASLSRRTLRGEKAVDRRAEPQAATSQQAAPNFHLPAGGCANVLLSRDFFQPSFLSPNGGDQGTTGAGREKMHAPPRTTGREASFGRGIFVDKLPGTTTILPRESSVSAAVPPVSLTPPFRSSETSPQKSRSGLGARATQNSPSISRSWPSWLPPFTVGSLAWSERESSGTADPGHPTAGIVPLESLLRRREEPMAGGVTPALSSSEASPKRSAFDTLPGRSMAGDSLEDGSPVSSSDSDSRGGSILPQIPSPPEPLSLLAPLKEKVIPAIWGGREREEMRICPPNHPFHFPLPQGKSTSPMDCGDRQVNTIKDSSDPWKSDLPASLHGSVPESLLGSLSGFSPAPHPLRIHAPASAPAQPSAESQSSHLVLGGESSLPAKHPSGSPPSSLRPSTGKSSPLAPSPAKGEPSPQDSSRAMAPPPDADQFMDEVYRLLLHRFRDEERRALTSFSGI